MTHTKGPWRYDSANCVIVSETEINDYGDGDTFPTTVFTLYSACGGEDSQADIALACAAPDMLAALQLFIDEYGNGGALDGTEIEAVALAAIAKAVQS